MASLNASPDSVTVVADKRYKIPGMKPSWLPLSSSFCGAAGCLSGTPIDPSSRHVFSDVVLSEVCEAVSVSHESAIEYRRANGTS
jgi:hypothetical protein